MKSMVNGGEATGKEKARSGACRAASGGTIVAEEGSQQ
jgi:hypothetical protein